MENLFLRGKFKELLKNTICIIILREFIARRPEGGIIKREDASPSSSGRDGKDSFLRLMGTRWGRVVAARSFPPPLIFFPKSLLPKFNKPKIPKQPAASL